MESFLHLDNIISDLCSQVNLTFSFLDKLKSIGLFRSLLNIFIRCVESTVKDVLLESVVEEHGLLLDKSEPLAQLNNVHTLDIDAIDEYLTKLRVVETHDKGDKGGLALS